jgi:UDP-GlcNAc3NAcA epimerase
MSDSSELRIAHVVGARPQFVKLAPVSRAIDFHNRSGTKIRSVVIHTGQHYDPAMSDVFFQELDLPAPDINLGIGSGSHARQTARMLEGLEQALTECQPHLVLTYGDTNSTLAATLAAAKLHLPMAHLEAGLRSFDRAMPEEVNRITADHLSDLLLAPTLTAMTNLKREGLEARAILTGDVMLDAARFFQESVATRSRILERLGLEPDGFLLTTVHRAESTEPAILRSLISALEAVAQRGTPVVFPCHPRTRAQIDRLQAGLVHNLRIIEPVGYLDMLALTSAARIVLTDSGGLQKEAFFLLRPCVTLRTVTEWNETVECGANVLAGSDAAAVVAAVEGWEQRLAGGLRLSPRAVESFGDGRASHRIIAALVSFIAQRSSTVPDRRGDLQGVSS